MVKFSINVADEVFAVQCCRPFTETLFAAFLTEEPDGIPLIMSRSRRLRITAHLEKEEGEAKAYYVEFLVLHELMAHALLQRDTLLVHGASVVADGEAVLFIAPSGMGKSTQTRLWTELLGDRAFIINDDKQLIRLIKDGATVYATPWGMVDPVPAVRSAPLKAVIFLRQGENHITPVAGADLFPQLMQASLRGETPQEIIQIAALQKRLLSAVDCYIMDCRPDLAAAQMAYNAVFHKKKEGDA